MTLLRYMCLVALTSILMPAANAQSPLSQLGGLKNLGGNASLNDSKIGAGLKEALSVGTKNAVHLVDKPGGYLDTSVRYAGRGGPENRRFCTTPLKVPPEQKPATIDDVDS